MIALVLEQKKTSPLYYWGGNGRVWVRREKEEKKKNKEKKRKEQRRTSTFQYSVHHTSTRLNLNCFLLLGSCSGMATPEVRITAILFADPSPHVLRERAGALSLPSTNLSFPDKEKSRNRRPLGFRHWVAGNGTSLLREIKKETPIAPAIGVILHSRPMETSLESLGERA